MQYGDVHNFGKRTRLVVENNRRYYLKPRPVFWEWLHAGKSSPLLEFFQRDSGTQQLFGSFFGLVTTKDQVQNNRYLYSNEVLEVSVSRFDKLKQLDKKEIELLFYQFGSLCAYAYAFGLYDINYENALITVDNQIQLVDVELVFYEPRFLTDTTLVSTGDAFLNHACLSFVLKSLNVSSIDCLVNVIDGFYAGIMAFYNISEEIKLFLRGMEVEINQFPIRSIFRPTRIYHAWRIKNGFEEVPVGVGDKFYRESIDELSRIEHTFFPEELEQLKRGDFPYFFCTLQNKNVKFVGSSEGLIKSVESVEGLEYVKNFPKPNLNLDQRFSREKLIDSFLPVGLMEILWDFLPKEFEGKIDCKNVNVAINELAIRIDDRKNAQVYIADRFYNSHDVKSIIDARLGILRKNK